MASPKLPTRAGDGPKLELFGVPAHSVTSGTRAKWSEKDVQAFHAFAKARRDAKDDKNNGLTTSTDITDLLVSLNLVRFATVRNNDGEALGPILDVKVRRKLITIYQRLPSQATVSAQAQGTQMPDSEASLQRTRLQTARVRAIEKGQEPPTSLPAPKPFVPEPWPDRSSVSSSNKNKKKASLHNLTVEEARKEVSRLSRLLGEAEKRLDEAEKRESESKYPKGRGKAKISSLAGGECIDAKSLSQLFIAGVSHQNYLHIASQRLALTALGPGR